MCFVDYQRAMTPVGQVAALAMSFLIATKFGGTRFSGRVMRKVKVEAPSTESKGGARQTRESIVLRPESGDAKETITCGFLDVGQRLCDLRSYAALKALHQQRTHTALDLDQREYDAFLAELKILIDQEGFAIALVGADQQQAKNVVVAQVEETSSNTLIMIAIGVVVALVVGAVTILLAMK